jgi:membrane fusion protein (multidrug efflux system)
MAAEEPPVAEQDTPTDTPTAEKAPRQSPLRNPVTRLILIVVVLAILIGGGLWFWHYEVRGKFLQSTNDAYVQSDAIVVSPKVGGYVDQVYVIDNQQVHAGDPLVRIDPRDYQAQAEQYRAQVDVAAANAQGVRAQISEQQATIQQSQAQLAVATSALAFARSQTARYAPLASTGAETGEKLAQLRDQEKQAKAQVDAASAAVTNAQRRIGSLQAQIGQAQSQGRAAEAQLSAANVNLGSTIVRASSDGRVGDKSVQLGQYVQPGLRMMSIVPVQKLYVSANFKETQLGLMRVGQPVTAKVDALDGVNVIGRVESISPGTGAQFSLLPPQNATGNFTKIVQRVPVRVAIDLGPETRKLLVPGMSVTVTVDTISARDAPKQIEREQDDLNRRQGK